MKATGSGEAPRWRPDLEQRSRVKTKFAIHKFQNEVSYTTIHIQRAKICKIPACLQKDRISNRQSFTERVQD